MAQPNDPSRPDQPSDPDGRSPFRSPTPAERGDRRDQQAQSEQGARALDFLMQSRVAGIERATIYRTFHQISTRDADSLDQQWWQVFSDAASALQLRPSVMDCSVDQIIRMVSDGADIVLYQDPASDGEHGGWSVIRGCRVNAKAVDWWDGPSLDTKRFRKPSKMRRDLEDFTNDQRVRCVAFDWRETSIGEAHQPLQNMKPLTRTLHLMRAEWSDIWLVIVFAFVVGLLMLATPIAVESLVNTVAFGRFFQPIVMLALVLFTFLGFSAAIKALQTYIVEVIQQRMFARIAGDLSHRLPRVSTEGTDGKYLPELVNRFFDVVTVQKVSASLLLDGITLVLSAVIGMAVLGFYHPFLLGFDALLLACIAFIVVVLGRGAVKTAVQESKSKYYMAAWLEDVARCPTTFRTAAGKRMSASRSDRLVYDYLVNRKKHFRVLMRQIVFALGLQAFASTVLLGLGGYLVVIGELTLGQLVAAELIVAVIVGAFAKMGKHFESYYDLLASVDKLGALFDLPLARQGSILHPVYETPASIEMEKVQYTRGGKQCFAPVTISLPSHGSTAFYGASGSGKSTLLDLIYGTRRPKSGQVKVDGSQPGDLQTDDFWSHVELVREGEIFASTVEENLHLQRSDVSGQDVEDALEEVGLLKLISAMPDGLQTHLASDGAPLTSNQCRLLLIARAIAESPNLMMIDGVLDSLSDEEAELALSALLRPDRPWTLIIATGRRWIAQQCDATLRLPLGEVTANDTAAAN